MLVIVTDDRLAELGMAPGLGIHQVLRVERDRGGEGWTAGDLRGLGFLGRVSGGELGCD